MRLTSTTGRRLEGGRGRRRQRQRLRQLRADGDRGVDLHARQRQCRGAGAQRGATLTDSFTALTADGTAQLVTITINGANDAAVITGDRGGSCDRGRRHRQRHARHADRRPAISIPTDVDNPDDTWQAVRHGAATANGYGTYTLTAAGVWIYTLDNSNAAVQALNGAATLTDSFTVATVDGTAQLVTITIAAQNDAPVITGDAAGSVIEAGGVANGTPGMPTDTGDLNSTDVDNPADAWKVVRPAPPPPTATAATR